MKILNSPNRTLIKPYNIYLHYDVPKKAFLNGFNQDELSFTFLYQLIAYCCQFTSGDWTTVTPTILKKMSDAAGSTIDVKATELFKRGYLIERDGNIYLTHEFVVISYMYGGDGNFLPLSSGHIDFSKTKEVSEAFSTVLAVDDAKFIDFMMLIIDHLKDKRGTLLDANLPLGFIGSMARDAGIHPAIIGIDLGYYYRLIEYDEEVDGTVCCNGLLGFFYLVAPKGL